METSRQYAPAVSERLKRHPQVGAVVLFANIGPTSDWGRPVDRAPTARNIARWTQYVEAPWAFAASRSFSADMVLIDGPFRLACALRALLEVHSSGNPDVILMDDYLERTEYHPVSTFAELKSMAGCEIETEAGVGSRMCGIRVRVPPGILASCTRPRNGCSSWMTMTC